MPTKLHLTTYLVLGGHLDSRSLEYKVGIFGHLYMSAIYVSTGRELIESCVLTVFSSYCSGADCVCFGGTRTIMII